MAGDPQIEKTHSLCKAFLLSGHETVAIVGAGGKSSLLTSLAEELARLPGIKVITTTTTHILKDQARGQLLTSKDPDYLFSKAQDVLVHHPHVSLACCEVEKGKLKGLEPGTISKISTLADYTLVEADGASRKPLKAPNSTEPVFPPSTTLTIAVVGIDALSRPLEEVTFRPGIAADLAGAKPSDTVTPEIICSLLTHPGGIIKGSPPAARTALLINKVEEKTFGPALKIARLVEKQAVFSRVIIGSLKPEPVVLATIS